MDEDLFVPLLPQLAPTRVNVSKQLILELAVTALKLTTSQSVHHEEDEDRFFAIIEIHVPPEINMPRLNTKLFAGDYCQTMEGAIESASLNALLYMQTENIVVIDDLNLPRLVRCRKELVQAKSWSDIFEHATVRLKQKVAALEKEVQLLKAGSALSIPTEHNTTTKEPRQQISSVQLEPSSPDEEHNDAGANKQYTDFITLSSDAGSSMSAAKKHAHASAFQQKSISHGEHIKPITVRRKPNTYQSSDKAIVQAYGIQQLSTPPHGCTELVSLQKKCKKNQERLPVSRSLASESPSGNIEKEHHTCTRRALFTSNKDASNV